MRNVVLMLIRIYQRFISPVKGFRCAYGVVHNGNSCSVVIYEIFHSKGIVRGIPLARSQLKKCSEAYRELSDENNKDKNEKSRKKRRKKEDGASWCDAPCYGLDCIPIGRCGGGKGGGGADCDLPFDCSP